MSCGQARKVIYLAERLEPVSPEWVRAQEHLQQCAQCQTFFSQEEALRDLLKKRLARQGVPAHLRERILEQIAEAHAQQGSRGGPFALKGNRVPVAIAVALGALVALVIGIVSYQSLPLDRQERVLAEFIDDHLRFRPGASQIESSRAEQVEAWFSGKVDFLVQAPRFEQAELLGGRLCYLFGKKGALLSYEKHGTLLSFYILEGSDIKLDRFEQHAFRDNSFAYGMGKGHNLVIWKDRGLLYALVSDLQKEELVRLASNVSSRRG